MGKERNVYRVLVGKPEGKRLLVRPRRRREDGIKMDLMDIVWGGCGVDSTLRPTVAHVGRYIGIKRFKIFKTLKLSGQYYWTSTSPRKTSTRKICRVVMPLCLVQTVGRKCDRGAEFEAICSLPEVVQPVGPTVMPWSETAHASLLQIALASLFPVADKVP
jgi:hypothetical protein